jgi:hypothetical protein
MYGCVVVARHSVSRERMQPSGAFALHNALVGFTPLSDTHVGDLPRRGAGERIDHSGHQGAEILHAIRAGVQHDDGQAAGGDVLLEGEIAVHRNERRKATRAHEAQELPIAPPRPSPHQHVRDVER